MPVVQGIRSLSQAGSADYDLAGFREGQCVHNWGRHAAIDMVESECKVQSKLSPAVFSRVFHNQDLGVEWHERPCCHGQPPVHGRGP